MLGDWAFIAGIGATLLLLWGGVLAVIEYLNNKLKRSPNATK